MALIDTEDGAKRLARVILSDIELYQQEKIKAGDDLSDELSQGRALFHTRVVPDLAPIFDTVVANRRFNVLGARPAVVEAPRPAAVEAPRPAVAEVPRPAVVEAARPVVAEAPRPVVVEAPRPAAVEAPRPVVVAATPAAVVEAPRPAAVAAAPAPTEVSFDMTPVGGTDLAEAVLSEAASEARRAQAPVANVSLPVAPPQPEPPIAAIAARLRPASPPPRPATPPPNTPRVAPVTETSAAADPDPAPSQHDRVTSPVAFAVVTDDALAASDARAVSAAPAPDVPAAIIEETTARAPLAPEPPALARPAAIAEPFPAVASSPPPAAIIAPPTGDDVVDVRPKTSKLRVVLYLLATAGGIALIGRFLTRFL